MNGFLKGGLIATAIAIPIILFWSDLEQMADNNMLPVVSASVNSDKEKDKNDKKEKKKKDEVAPSAHVQVIKKWELPSQLTEISGMAYISQNQFACIQDELGTIFIYNTASQKIEREIPFGPPGDYEGIAIAGQTAYVVRADGKLYEVANFMGSKPDVRQYNTPLTVKHDVEGLCYDPDNNRLLLAIKGKEPHTEDYKGIYGFDLTTKKMASAPVYKIDLTHAIWNDIKEKKVSNIMQPSEIAIHPTTGDLYITDGANPKLLIMDTSGSPKALHHLSKSDFKQPEGIAFTPGGELYISSEGGKGKGIIARVALAAD